MLAKAAVLVAPARPRLRPARDVAAGGRAVVGARGAPAAAGGIGGLFGRRDPAPAAERALEEVVLLHPRGALAGPADGGGAGSGGGVGRARSRRTPTRPLTLVLAAGPGGRAGRVPGPQDDVAASRTRRTGRTRRRPGPTTRCCGTPAARSPRPRSAASCCATRTAGGRRRCPAGCCPGSSGELALADGRRARAGPDRRRRCSEALARGGELWFLNSVRGWRRATLLPN